MTEHARFCIVVTTVAAKVAALDWVTKWWAHWFLAPCVDAKATQCAAPHVSEYVTLLLVRNAGSALGFAQGLGLWALVAVGGLLVTGLVIKQVTAGGPGLVGAGLLVGGGVANVTERVVLSEVTDFIALGPREGPFVAMNVADIALLLGALLVTINLNSSLRRRARLSR